MTPTPSPNGEPRSKRKITFARQLKLLGACEEAVAWAGKRTLALAWKECERGDWMLWLLSKCDGWSREVLNRCNLDFMADALESARPQCEKEAYWPQVENAHRLVREAIAGSGDLSAAESAAWSAASAAASASRSAASAAWSAASAAASAAWSAESAAWSAASAAASASRSAASAASAARSAAWKRHADIVRKHFPKAPKLKVKR